MTGAAPCAASSANCTYSVKLLDGSPAPANAARLINRNWDNTVQYDEYLYSRTSDLVAQLLTYRCFSVVKAYCHVNQTVLDHLLLQ